MESPEQKGLETEVLQPAERALEVIDFVKDMRAFRNADQAPVELAPKANELLEGQRIAVGGQEYLIKSVGPDFAVTAEVLVGGFPSGQEVLIPWITLRGFDLAK